MKKLKITNCFTILLIATLILAGGCSSTNNTDTDETKLQIYTPAYIFTLVTEEIASDANVSNLYPSGADRHHFEFTPQDLQEISSSDIVIYISEEEDPAIASLASTDDDDTTYINLSEDPYFIELFTDYQHSGDIEKHEEEEEHEGHDHSNSTFPDFHFWLTPAMNDIYAQFFVNFMEESSNDSTTDFEGNYEILAPQLKALDEDYQAFGDKQTKSLIVSHDAYTYYNYFYNIDYFALTGTSHDDEASTTDFRTAIDLINEQNTNYIIYEETDPNNATMQTIQTETKTDKLEILLLSSVPTDEELAKKNAIELLQYNLEILEQSQN